MKVRYKTKPLVTAVENGKLALEALRNPDYDFDLILLDLNMPEMVRLDK